MNKFAINPKLNKIRLEFLPCFELKGEMEEVVDVERVVVVVLGGRTGGWWMPGWRQKAAGQDSGGQPWGGGEEEEQSIVIFFLFMFESCLITWMTMLKEYLAEN